MENKPERCLSSRKIYDGRILNLRVDEIELPDGSTAVREVVEHTPAVGVLAVTERDTVMLVRQYRYAVDEYTLEICAGLVEVGEDVKAAALREMQEELGYVSSFIREIGRFYATPGFCTEMLVLFLATGLTPSKLPQDEDENVEAVEVKIELLPELLASGHFRDAKTFAAISWLLGLKGLFREEL